MANQPFCVASRPTKSTIGSSGPMPYRAWRTFFISRESKSGLDYKQFYEIDLTANRLYHWSNRFILTYPYKCSINWAQVRGNMYTIMDHSNLIRVRSQLLFDLWKGAGTYYVFNRTRLFPIPLPPFLKENSGRSRELLFRVWDEGLIGP